MGSPVVSATVVGQGRRGTGKDEEEEGVGEVKIVDLKDPITIVLQLLSEVRSLKLAILRTQIFPVCLRAGRVKQLLLSFCLYVCKTVL